MGVPATVRLATFLSTTLKLIKSISKRHIAFVSQFRMEIIFAVMDINPFQDKLNAETFSPDMLYNTLVFLVNGFQNKPAKDGELLPSSSKSTSLPLALSTAFCIVSRS
jgi:hypothetical protein